MPNLPLAEREAMAVDRPAPTVGSMLQAVIDKGITPDNAAALSELVKLYEHMQERDAEKAFAKDFIRMQSELQPVKATKIIPDKQGNMRSSFAPFEEIDAQCRPICARFGFSYSFSEGENPPPGKITKICTLQHIGGHKRSNPFTVRIGSGPPGCSEAQSDGAAHSYAKRGALCDCLNIVVLGIDNDARNDGGFITEKQADELARRVQLTNSDRDKFLAFANAKCFKEIPAAKYGVLDEYLAKKEKQGR